MDTAALFTTVSTKGQVILPKAVRDQLNWDAGTRLIVERSADGVLLRPVTVFFVETRPDDVFGCLARPGEAVSIEAMDAGIAVQARTRHARGRY